MELLAVFTAFGLAASAGLNAYIPLLTIALLAKFTNLITLDAPWDTLENWWIIGLLGFLVAVEFIADKVPAVNHANDVLMTFIRPAAGAIAFAASTSVISDINPVLAMAMGSAGCRRGAHGQSRGGAPGGDRVHGLGWQRSGEHGGRYRRNGHLGAFDHRSGVDRDHPAHSAGVVDLVFRPQTKAHAGASIIGEGG